MSDLVSFLRNLHRPRLLIRAARHGVQDYNRNRDLTRLLRTGSAPTPTRAVNSLINEEARLEDTRKTGDASYSVSRHVEILIALMAEARLLPARNSAV